MHMTPNRSSLYAAISYKSILLITLGRNYSKNKLLKNIFEREKEYNQYLKSDENLNKEINTKNLDNIN